MNTPFTSFSPGSSSSEGRLRADDDLSAQSDGRLPSAHDAGLGEGEMAERIRTFDWSKTPLGPPSSWSPALRTTLEIVLASRFPHLLWWGPQYIQLYNDAYRPIPGAKHPDRVLGRPASECWAEIWPVIGPLIDGPFQGGPATWDDDIALEMLRHGYLEESHFIIAYSPVPDHTVPNGIGGVLATVHEITEKIVAERRVRALRDLGARGGDAKTAEEACAIAATALAGHAKDVPFALIYLVDSAGAAQARLVASAGVGPGSDVAPAAVDLRREAATPWPLGEAVRTESMQVVERLGDRFSHVPQGPWSDPPHTAVVVPVPSNKPHDVAALLVLGVSARLKFDEPHRDFFHLLQTQIATGIANARAYEEERRRAEALAEIDRAKTAFFSNVSHEFRTPLTLMLGPIEDVLGRAASELSPVARGQLDVVHRNGLRLLRLVNTLLDFSRIEAGRSRASFQATDLPTLTADLASVFRSAFEKAGLRLTLDCPPLDEPVYVDREMWEKIVLNLLSNAFKYTFEGGVDVSLRRIEAGVELRVTDTGIGIPEDELPKIFERFHRVQSARGRTHEGSGIGLALVQELVRQHGGNIRASSRVGRGTALVVTLPLGSAHLAPDQIAEPQTAGAPTSGAIPYVEEALRWLPEERAASADAADEVPSYREIPPTPVGVDVGRSNERPLVLVADDNADMRQYVARLLADRYRVEVAPDGEDALDAARRLSPALILSDVMMPRLDGFGLLRAVRADQALRETPVILLSARAGEESRVAGVESGADDYLVKPFSARELIARVDAHLKMARLRRETREWMRRSNEEMRSRAEQFETLLDAAPLGLFLVDADLRIVEMNPVARTVFAEIPGGVVGRDFGDVIHRMLSPERADGVVRVFRHTLATGKPHAAAEQSEYRIDRGVTEDYEWRLERIVLPSGRYGLVCYFRDISALVQGRRERERLLAAEQAARAQAESANSLKDDFVATLSHELRTPLNAIVGWSELLQRGRFEPSTLRQGIDAIHRSAMAQAKLIEDLLDISRIVAGKLRLDRKPVNAAAVVDAAAAAVVPVAEAKKVRIEKALDPNAGSVLADPSRLQQIVWNLMTNAVKFTPSGGRIEVGLRRADAVLEISVRDTGAGIAPEFLPFVFDRFRQADSSTSRKQGGLGIGLTLVQELVGLHGGTVEVHSDGVGRGAAFTVRLPLSTAMAVEDVPSPVRRTADVTLDGVDVLYVEDDADARALGQYILSDRGARVVVAGSAAEALTILRAKRPHVLVSDIGLPDVDGYELIRRLRALGEEDGGRIPAIALTAFAGADDRRRALAAGYQRHVSKPIVPDELVTVVAALAAKR